MTAATRAGSRPFLCDCCRMMSSWRSGSVISCTACLSGCRPISSTTPRSVISPRTRLRRRRRTFAARRAAAVGRPLLVALAAAILSQLLKHFRQLGLQLLNRPVVADDEIRSLGLFVLGQLPCGPCLDQLVSARRSAPGANLLFGHDGDRPVEHRFHSRLEQQRPLHDRRGLILRTFAEFRNPPAHARPEDALEPFALPVVS